MSPDVTEYDPNERTDAMDSFELDGEGMSEDNVHSGGGGLVNAEGMYHFEVELMEPELDTKNRKGEDKSPCLRFDLTVCQDVDGQSPSGARLFHRVYVGGRGGEPLSDAMRRAAFAFAMATSIAKEVDTEKTDGEGKTIMAIVDRETGKALNLASYKRAIGAHCIGHVEFEKGSGGYKDQYKINWGNVWHPFHPKVASVPKDLQLLAQSGYEDDIKGKASPEPDVLEDEDL